jgi:hypothetical protein
VVDHFTKCEPRGEFVILLAGCDAKQKTKEKSKREEEED